VSQRRELRDLQTKQRQELRGKPLAERRQLRAQQRKEMQELRATQRAEREQAGANARGVRRELQDAAAPRDRLQGLREQQRKQRAERREQRLQQQQGRERTRASGSQLTAVTPEQARQGRFAARYFDRADRRDARRAARILAREAWRRGQHAQFVAWAGPVFWPYVYTDMFYYTFWPYAYDDAYWAYAYDDFFTAVFFAYSPDYYDDIYAAPYPEPMTTGSAPRGMPTRETRRAIERVCDPDQGLTAWPFDQIERAVSLTEEQGTLLGELRQASKEAVDAFKASCDPEFAMTPPGRLKGMISRLQASLDAVQIVRPALEKFYNALSDEQKARFNAIGPKIGAQQSRTAQAREQASTTSDDCGGAKQGLTALPMNRIADAVQPSSAQRAAFDKLAQATDNAVAALESACPDTIALTPVGRMEAMQQRLEAMLDAAETVQPALEVFYAALSSEQKARFNSLGREARN